MKKYRSYIIAVIILLVIGSVWYWKSKKNSNTQQIQYITSVAEKGTLTSSVTASGNVTVDQLSTVDPTISGTVTNLAVKVGDHVDKGQYLFTIDNDQLSVSVTKSVASLYQSQGSLESAKQQKKQAEADYDAAKKKDKATPDTYTSDQLKAMKDKIDVTKASVTTAEQNLIAAQADLANQRSNAAERQVTAPISGTVNEINIKNGDDLGKLSSSSTKSSPIIIGDFGTLKASVSVNEVDIANVYLGQKAMLKFDSLDGLAVSGKVEKIDALGTVTQGVVSYDVTIGFDTLDERIKPQMSVTASIITDVKQDVLVVPSSAVKTENGNTYVEVLSGQIPEQKTVKIGSTNNTDTEIVSGINVGDKVVTQTINPTAVSTTSSTNVQGGIRLPGMSGGNMRR